VGIGLEQLGFYKGLGGGKFEEKGESQATQRGRPLLPWLRPAAPPRFARAQATNQASAWPFEKKQKQQQQQQLAAVRQAEVVEPRLMLLVRAKAAMKRATTTTTATRASLHHCCRCPFQIARCRHQSKIWLPK
jgi:hypothetical protein